MRAEMPKVVYMHDQEHDDFALVMTKIGLTAPLGVWGFTELGMDLPNQVIDETLVADYFVLQDSGQSTDGYFFAKSLLQSKTGPKVIILGDNYQVVEGEK